MHQLIYYNMGSKSAIGIGNGICFKQVRDKGGGSYIDPLVRDSLVGVWIADQNTNESPTRNIIKNTIKDKGGDLELLNFGYKLNSGYNGYVTDFTEWKSNNTNRTQTKITVSKDINFPVNLASFENATNAPSFRIKVSGLPKGQNLYYKYINEEGLLEEKFNIPSDGIYTLPATAVSDTPTTVAMLANEQYNINIKGLTIEQLPLYEGALVTDGKDDMIVSQKTVQEMLGGSNEVTVVSMIHQIGLSSRTTINNIRSESVAHVVCRNICSFAGKTGIYGYSGQINTNNPPTLINNILGDKKDYTAEGDSALDPTDKFFVQGYKYSGSISEVSPIAYYWTFVSNKVLTTDQINQVIFYFNLDKHVKPDVYYDVKKQGLSNDTPEADWYLKDFSGNGHDMTLYNFAKKLGSGIGKYEVDFNTWTPQSYVADSAYTSNKLHITNIKGGNAILYTKKGANAMKVKITGIQSFNLVYRYIAENDVWKALEVDRDGIYELPASTTTTKTYYTGFTVPYYTGDCDITIEQIPDYEGALVSDGIDDYGKVENLPIYKDYTVVADREIIDGLAENADGGVAVRGTSISNGAFGFDYKNEVYSFATPNSKVIDVERFISYQSKYVNNGTNINAGNIVDANPLTIGKLGSSTDRYSKLALWSFLLFPYTLSEFLLERQLKRYKFGTLYPDMVEFRPVIKSNASYDNIVFYYKNEKVENETYLTVGSSIGMHIRLSSSPVNEIKSITITINGIPATFKFHDANNNIYQYDFNLTSKSPQKINITIDEYIRFEDIIQPYPAIVNLSQDGKSITWGDKLKVGSEVTFVNHINILPEIYGVSGRVLYNGADIKGWNSPIIVAKSMVFTSSHVWKLNTTEPHAIYSPQKLNIPNSSLKILGYVPDLTGKGNHGKLNNFAYTEDSGVAADGSIKFDGTDDHITIPTLAHGGKCMLMKVNWNKDALMLYDQRRDNNPNSFAIYISNFNNNEDSIAYSSRNDGKTYIDGVLNTSVKGSQLKDITHNITITNSNSNNDNTVSPAIGSNAKYNAFYAQMVLYEFMLLPDVPDEEEIKELNDVMGIEGGYVERPEYYWDVYGKTNSDVDRATIIDQVSKDPANAFTANNFAYSEESGYGGISSIYKFATEPTSNQWQYVDDRASFEILNNGNAVRITNVSSSAALFYQNFSSKAYYKISGISSGHGIKFGHDGSNVTWEMVIEEDGVYEVDWTLNVNINGQHASNCIMSNGWQGDCNIIIEQIAQYQNGLVGDGIEDNLKNANMPVLTDYTWIIKRKFTDISRTQSFAYKGTGNNSLAFLFEFIEYGQKTRSFGHDNTVVFPDLISYQTKNIYNGEAIATYNTIDGNQLRIFMGRDQYPRYAKAVFYKAILYSKTIDALSINMLKNLFERDELIDITNPIFKKKEL